VLVLHLPAVLVGLLLVVVHLQDPATAGLHLPAARRNPTAQQQWQHLLLLRALGAVLTVMQLAVLIGQLLVLRLLSLTGAGPHQQVLHHSQPARLHLVYHGWMLQPLTPQAESQGPSLKGPLTFELHLLPADHWTCCEFMVIACVPGYNTQP
jgi:hypothetical protein